MYGITKAFFILSVFCLVIIIITIKPFYGKGVGPKYTDGSSTKPCVNEIERIKSNVTHLCYPEVSWSSLFIPKYVAKGDLLYYGRVLVNGSWAYFIIDHKNLYEPVTYTSSPVFHTVADLQEFVQIHYPHVLLKKCPCGCWSE